MSKQIPLSRGLFAIVDDEEFEAMSAFKWHAVRWCRSVFYAARNSEYVAGKSRKTILMHREIVGLSVGDQAVVDHRNHNGLDNQKHNLRKCSLTQNLWNQGPRRISSTGFKGVFTRKRGFQSAIMADGKTIWLGRHKTAEAAARAYDAAAKELHGEFAYLNFPDEQPQARHQVGEADGQ